MNITILGSGCVGFVSGACLADVGDSLIGVDMDEMRIETLCASREGAPVNTDASIIGTEGKTFRTAEPALFSEHLRELIIVDGRNLFDPAAMASSGIDYHAFGRPQSVRS